MIVRLLQNAITRLRERNRGGRRRGPWSECPAPGTAVRSPVVSSFFVMNVLLCVRQSLAGEERRVVNWRGCFVCMCVFHQQSIVFCPQTVRPPRKERRTRCIGIRLFLSNIRWNTHATHTRIVATTSGQARPDQRAQRAGRSQHVYIPQSKLYIHVYIKLIDLPA